MQSACTRCSVLSWPASLVGESPILTRQIDEQLRGLVAGLFMPVFFGLAGLSADLTILKSGELALLTALIVLIATVGKAGGAFVGGYFGGLSGKNRWHLPPE